MKKSPAINTREAEFLLKQQIEMIRRRKEIPTISSLTRGLEKAGLADAAPANFMVLAPQEVGTKFLPWQRPQADWKCCFDGTE